MTKYARTIDELAKHAVLFWPKELLERESAISVLPLLIQTQDKFISTLNLADSTPDSWKKLIDVSEELRGNLFLKHLMVLSDLGGEALNKLPPLTTYFSDGKMKYLWRGTPYEYQFKVVNRKTTLTNSALHVDGPNLLKGFTIDSKMEDVIMLLLHGASSTNDTLPDDVKSKCSIGMYIGYPTELDKFVKQSYIRISKQVSGATANSLGQIAQNYSIEILKAHLPSWEFVKNGSLPNVSHTGGETDTTFDISARSPRGKYFGIEVSFQVTTNSTIERKAGQAEARANMVRRAGHKICYIIDGAGNINIRKSAVGTICQYSDCTVALSEKELLHLANFMKENA